MHRAFDNIKERIDSQLHGSSQKPLGQPAQEQAPPVPESSKPQVAADANAAGTHSSLTVSLQNDSNSSTVYAYITGHSIDHGNKLFLLRADGRIPYYPSNPSRTGSHLTEDCSIKLGGPGTTHNVTIPHIAGGRVWFSINKPLTFLLNPGPALVEPSVTNETDPNYHIEWDFCEFTYNSAQLFANITYVDFVSLPIALTMETAHSGTKHISGMRSDGLSKTVESLHAQQKTDGKPWSRLIVNGPNGQPLRVLSPNAGRIIAGDLFHDYYKSYVDRVWAKYASADLHVNTQASYGTLEGRVHNNQLTFSDGSTFFKPTAEDIFSCSTGPFTGSNPSKLALIPRIAAALNRSTLLRDAEQPGAGHGEFYREEVTNHYSRIVHEHNVDGRGYAFPYDDVVGKDGFESAGTVFDGVPRGLTVVVGGRNAHK
ncbi:MAG: hypothetical protein MMC23_008758 [Stictis urceolatum]|nr:hypothetical protein [Stictis urceolata]